MAGVTDTVFRRFIRNLGGCGLIMTEFTSADGVLRAKDQKAKRYLHFYEDEHPISAQLFGSDPKVMADAARIVEDLGFDLAEPRLQHPPACRVRDQNSGRPHQGIDDIARPQQELFDAAVDAGADDRLVEIDLGLCEFGFRTRP